MLEPQSSPDILLKNCKICRAIWSCFWEPNCMREISLGHPNNPVLHRCPGHSPLFAHWCDYLKDDLPEQEDGGHASGKEDTGDLQVSKIGGTSEALRETQAGGANEMIIQGLLSEAVVLARTTNGQCSVDLQAMMLRKDSVPDHPGTGNRLDPDWIDLQLATKWKQKCLEKHGPQCNNPLKISPVRPLWVIDVKSECIVPGRDCPAFVALSYRWGSHSWPRAEFSAVQKPGALAAADLAPMIRHAMCLTLAIGERYLWVDALCIAQGDNSEILQQLNLMGAFYASAVLTIVVADGDSAVGIPGLKGISGPRSVNQTLVPFCGETIIFQEFDLDLGEHRKRGWTYQEYIMSQRRLIFAGGSMHWICHCSDWHEDVIFDAEVDRRFLYPEPEPGRILAGLPDLECLRELMSTYNSRSFRYEEDVLPGISGLLSLFSRSFQGGFLCGLPEMFFDRALGWCASSDLQRRKPSGRSVQDRLPDSLEHLPSWSWAGWKGNIFDNRLEPVELIRVNLVPRMWNPNYEAVEETFPITTWFTSRAPDGAALRQIHPTWYENRNAQYENFESFAKPLPEGWITRNKIQPAPIGADSSRLLEYHGHIFRHSRFSHEDWYFPFPISEVQESTPQSMPEQTPYLFCKTHKARLWAVCSLELWEDIEKKSKNYHTAFAVERNIRILQLRTGRSGPAVGEIYLHNTDQLVPFLQASGESIKTGRGQPVDLVAIYRTRVHEWQRGKAITNSERYRVLWTEWDSGIAYRLGVGWVERAAWEASERTEIDLVLG